MQYKTVIIKEEFAKLDILLLFLHCTTLKNDVKQLFLENVNKINEIRK